MSELVVKYDREHLTVWGNSSNQVVKKCYKEVGSRHTSHPLSTRRRRRPDYRCVPSLRQNPRIPVLFSLPRVLQLLGLFYTGLLPFVPLKEQFLEIPMPSIINK